MTATQRLPFSALMSWSLVFAAVAAATFSALTYFHVAANGVNIMGSGQTITTEDGSVTTERLIVSGQLESLDDWLDRHQEALDAR